MGEERFGRPTSSGRCALVAAAALAFAQAVAAAKAPEIDAFADAAPNRRALSRAVEDMARPGTTVHFEERLGVPTFIQPARTGENGRRALERRSVEAEDAARAHVLDLAPAWGLTPEDVLKAPVGHVHDTRNGPVVVQIRQEAFGVPVFRDEIRIAMNRSFDPVAVSGYLPSVAGLSEPVFTLDAPAAVVKAAEGLGERGIVRADLTVLGSAPGGYEVFALTGARRPLFASPVRVRKVLFHLPEDLVPAWYVELDIAGEGASSDLYACVVSARDGSVLYRHSLMEADAGYGYRVWAEPEGLKMPLNGPQGRAGDPYPGTAPDRWQAPFVAPSLVTLSSGPISTNDPWLPAGATETNGNNVDAYADLKAPDGFSDGDVRADVTSPGSFDRTYDVASAPNATVGQRKAAVAQLFYTTNFLHDWFYDSGFNEVAGNAQASNYGRGGIDGDSLRAEAQDSSGTDNANMSTPADGGPPRMQMFVWALGTTRSVSVTAPASAPRNLAAGNAAFGPGAFSTSGELALADDGTAARTAACSPLVNAQAVAGKIALVDRGTCAFNLQVANAQAAGAIGVIVANNADDTVFTMGETAGATALPYSIPALFVGWRDGGTLRSLIPEASVTLSRTPNRDGAIDAQVVTHEWGHYLSNRLVGNANGLRANQSRGLGEGWSDFCALLLTVQAGDSALPGNDGYRGIYANGGYSSGGVSPVGGPSQSWYFGVRRYPYSTDMSINPLTYAHISNGVSLPPGPAVYVELLGGGVRDGSNNAEAHNTGEVWATMLWECYAALLRDSPRLTFDEARNRMRGYLVASLKLTPINPTLLEARDALLAVAFADGSGRSRSLRPGIREEGRGAPCRGHAGPVRDHECGGRRELRRGRRSCGRDGASRRFRRALRPRRLPRRGRDGPARADAQEPRPQPSLGYAADRVVLEPRRLLSVRNRFRHPEHGSHPDGVLLAPLESRVGDDRDPDPRVRLDAPRPRPVLRLDDERDDPREPRRRSRRRRRPTTSNPRSPLGSRTRIPPSMRPRRLHESR